MNVELLASAIARVVVGTGLCWIGSDWLVDGLETIARAKGVPESVLGVLISAPGTSLPEFGSAIVSSLEGYSEVGVGCVVGSNVYNICGILGITALLIPFTIGKYPFRDTLIAVGVGILLLLLVMHGLSLEWYEAVFLLALYAVYAYSLMRREEEKPEEEKPEPDEDVEKTKKVYETTWKTYAKVVVGIGLFVVAIKWCLVDGTIDLAKAIGYPAALLGYTLLAIATSLPETFTTLNAARRGMGDLAVTNITGSNNFNILMGLGVPAIITGKVQAKPWDPTLILYMVVITAILAIPAYKGKLGRPYGALNLALYGGFIALLWETIMYHHYLHLWF